jgi:hypothetical protein
MFLLFTPLSIIFGVSQSGILGVKMKKPRTILERGQERMSDTGSSLGEVWLTYR